MKIDLQGAFIDAFNLRLQSQNLLIDCVNEDGPFFVIKSGSTDKELTSFRNLMYVGVDAYYLQTADYKENSSGLKIDLANGTIKAYNSFSLVAGSEATGGVILNATPSSTENYLFAGQTSTGFIKVTGAGVVSLYATDFTLSTSNIWLSDSGTTWNGHGDIVLGLGSNFAVDSKGNLYANNANLTNITASGTISGSTITGGTISGAKITASEMEASTITATEITNGQTFSLSSGGRLTCTSASIGGWEVGESSISNSSGGFTLNPSGGITSGYLNTDANGKTTIEDLEVLNSLTINGDAAFVCNGTGEITGDTEIGGKLHITGEVTLDSTVFKVGKATAWAAEAETIRVDVPFEKGYDITIHNGIITNVTKVEESGLTQWWNSITGNNATAGDSLGKLAWLDEVVISSATFKLGSSNAYNITPTLSGNTATFTVNIPGQSYSGYAGYSGTRYVYVDNPETNVRVASSHPGTGWTYKTSVTLGGDEYYSGTTQARTGTIAITVIAQ